MTDLFDVIKRLVDESNWTAREKDMAHALIDAHGSQYVANTERFDRKLSVHGGLLGLPAGSPQESRAMGEAL